jgi:hypothetical protein
MKIGSIAAWFALMVLRSRDHCADYKGFGFAMHESLVGERSTASQTLFRSLLLFFSSLLN